ncbi:hypothetical protein ACNKHQ_01070 [Shigella flexneri]
MALFRPGPLSRAWWTTSSSASTARAHLIPGREVAARSLKPILEPTYGIILYQEQVMQIAQTLAGYTLGGADMLRRAIARKNPKRWQAAGGLRGGGVKNGVDGELAMKIFDRWRSLRATAPTSPTSLPMRSSLQTLWLQDPLPGGVHGGGDQPRTWTTLTR